jgi:hypothetical protein
MRNLFLVGIVAWVASVSAPAFADMPGWPWPGPWLSAQSSTQLTCSDFRHDLGGLWSPTHPITLDCGVVIGPNVTFRQGEGPRFCHADLAATLSRNCP